MGKGDFNAMWQDAVHLLVKRRGDIFTRTYNDRDILPARRHSYMAVCLSVCHKSEF